MAELLHSAAQLAGLIILGRVPCDRGDLFRRSTLSASAGTSRSSARETDAPVYSRSHLDRLHDGRVSHCGRRLLSTLAEDAHCGYIPGHVDCTSGCGDLRACPDWGAGRPEYRRPGLGSQLLRRHASDMIQKGRTGGDEFETSAVADQQMKWWITDTDRRKRPRRSP